MRQLFVVSMIAGCGDSLRDDRFPTGSATIVTTRGYDAWLAVNVDEGSVSRIDRTSGDVQELTVGDEPTRITRVGKEYWVTLRGERAIAVLEDDDGKLKRSDVIPAGAEPHGIVATENGRRVYVANSQSDEVTEYDGKSREKLRTFSVQDEPKWLALHPNGRVLFVASAKNGTLSWVDLDSGEITPIHLPPGTRNDHDGGTIDLDVRNTGDIVVSPDGTQLAVPTLYADTDTSVDDPEEPSEPIQNGYGSAGLEVSRINPVLVTFDLDAHGRPGDGAGHGLFLASVNFDDRGQVLSFRSYPSSVACSPSSNEWVVTMEGSNVALVLSTKDNERNDDFGTSTDIGTAVPETVTSGGAEVEPPLPPTSIRQGGFEQRPIAIVTTGAGPRGVAFASDDEAEVHTFLDRAVQDLRFDEVEDVVDGLEGRNREGGDGQMLAAIRRQTISTPSLPEDVEAGRRLFYSAVDERMAGAGAGVSCSTCHADARNDGFTWTLRGELRNTPSLAGPVSETAPVTWSENVASVADEASLTSFLRMGGLGLTEVEASQIEAFVNSSRYPDTRRAEDDGPLVALGAEVFARPEVGCAACHNGGLFTDNQGHAVLDPDPVQTPTLRGISASAPYFHDGSAPNLRVVVDRSRNGAMGDTSSLDDHELDALVAYLESL